MDFSPGTNATIQASTLENQCYSIARSIQNFERSATYNPGDEINLITSSSDDDTQIFSGNCEVYCNHYYSDGAGSVFTYPNPYSNLPSWSEGTNGNGTSDNWVGALVERFLALAKLERDKTYNLASLAPKITNIQWTFLDEVVTKPVTYNCTLKIDFSLDFRVISSTNGAITEAKPYLVGTYPGL